MSTSSASADILTAAPDGTLTPSTTAHTVQLYRGGTLVAYWSWNQWVANAYVQGSSPVGGNSGWSVKFAASGLSVTSFTLSVPASASSGAYTLKTRFVGMSQTYNVASLDFDIIPIADMTAGIGEGAPGVAGVSIVQISNAVGVTENPLPDAQIGVRAFLSFGEGAPPDASVALNFGAAAGISEGAPGVAGVLVLPRVTISGGALPDAQIFIDTGSAMLISVWEMGPPGVAAVVVRRIADVVAPAPLAAPPAATPTDGGANLSWTPSASANLAAQDVSVNGALVVSLSAGANTHTLSGLENGKLYVIAIQGVNADGKKSAPKTQILIPKPATLPATPTGLAATAGIKRVSLTWDAAGGGVSYAVLARYPGNLWKRLATVTSTAYLVRGLATGVSYAYAVTATDIWGNISVQTATVTATAL